MSKSGQSCGGVDFFRVFGFDGQFHSPLGGRAHLLNLCRKEFEKALFLDPQTQFEIAFTCGDEVPGKFVEALPFFAPFGEIFYGLNAKSAGIALPDGFAHGVNHADFLCRTCPGTEITVKRR